VTKARGGPLGTPRLHKGWPAASGRARGVGELMVGTMFGSDASGRRRLVRLGLGVLAPTVTVPVRSSHRSSEASRAPAAAHDPPMRSHSTHS
jgi:hypothetical protein